jgi:aryl-alcohol dehydrogenase-like predicted oxidoreductase
MKYRKLGETGLTVSEIAYGVWGMSSWSGSDDRQSRESLKLSAELGCNFFDSAWAYGEGKGDAFVGDLKRTHKGSNLYMASKIPPMNRKWPASSRYQYAQVFPAEHVFKYVGLILGKAGLPCLDLLQFHVWDDTWADEKEFRETVTKLKRDGLIRTFGLSLNRWEPGNGIRALRTGLVDTVQVIYNIFDQSPEDELFPVCRELNIGVIARVPLDEGGLSGKLTPETTFAKDDWRSGYFNPENLRATLERVERLKAVLPKNTTLPEMALRFILSNPVVSTMIVGMRNPTHVRQNMAASDTGPLNPDLLAELKKHRWDRKPKPWSG